MIVTYCKQKTIVIDKLQNFRKLVVIFNSLYALVFA